MLEEFGRYTLLRRLAVGGMAEIFLAALHGDAGFEKKVVVKRILPHLGADPGFVKMFIDEAILAARLSHPNLVQVHDFGSVLGSYYIAMEYIDGLDLHRLLQRAQEHGRTLSLAEACVLGESIARGLSYTHNLHDDSGHSLGIVHRDVSPHNVMVSNNGHVKLLDFGIAKAAARFGRTATGTIKGKLAYMAPEQATGNGATKFSDQFALGAILWECLTGERLFASDTEVLLIKKVVECDISDIRTLRPEVPEALAAIVMRALARNPADRFSDLQDMESALVSFRFTLGKSGIVKLDGFTHELAPPEARAGDWSWADQHPQSGGTRALPAKATSLAPQRTQTPAHGTPSHGILARRRLLGAPILSRRRNTDPVPRHRTTLRIDRTSRSWLGVRVRYALSGLALMMLGVGFPLVLLSRAGHSTQHLHPAEDAGPQTLADLNPKHLGNGHLSLRSDGTPLEIYLGSNRLGSTPLSNADVPAGNLQLRLVNESAGIWRTYEIFVPEGGTAQGLISLR